MSFHREKKKKKLLPNHFLVEFNQQSNEIFGGRKNLDMIVFPRLNDLGHVHGNSNFKN